MGLGAAASDWSALTAGERRVLLHAMNGCPNKTIAMALALSGSTIAERLSAAARKFGVHSRVELIRTCRAGAPRAGPPPSLSATGVARLTQAEHDIVQQLLAGSSNAQIATSRRRSVRTVANQIASIYRKLGVASRSDLAARSFVEPVPVMAVPCAPWTSEPRSG